MKKVELLSPAGSFEGLKAAISFGADAVYLGGKAFNARINAKNFENDELGEGIKYARIRGKKVYVTLNTLLFDDEIKDIVTYVNNLQDMGANAVIVQDFGVAKVILEQTTMPIHASTQMGIHNGQGCKFLGDLGFSRAILSRETPLLEITKIKRDSDIEIETFIHGALCAGFSGQCLYSYLRGGRSGNRGECAQPCRLKCGEDDKYLLSTKDLMSVDLLPDLIKAGISSFKIEGRMKRPEYVGVVTGAYRRAIDAIYDNENIDTQKLKDELIKIYNRGGFTKGYYYANQQIFGNERPNHIGEEIGRVCGFEKNKLKIKTHKVIHVYDGLSFGHTGMEISDLYKDGKRTVEGEGELSFSCILKGIEPGDGVYRTTDNSQVSRIREVIEKDEFFILLDIKCSIMDGVTLTFKADNKSVTLNDNNICQTAISRQTKAQDVKNSLCKLGDTVFTVSNIDVEIKDGVYIAIKELNRLRREGVALLEKELTAGEFREKARAISANCEKVNLDIKVAIGFEGDKRPKECDVFLVYPTDEKGIIDADGIVLPPVTFESDLQKAKEKINNNHIVICNNISQIQYFKDTNRIWAGIGMNCTNKLCRDFLYGIGCSQIISSIEARVLGTLMVAKGHLPVMTFVKCPMQEEFGCDKCKKTGGSCFKGEPLKFKCIKLDGRYSFLIKEYKSNLGQVEYI